ncbi:MAG: MFS transporter [Prevotella sp.]|jgi:predicted MFS family arabinose efflux permease
MKQLIDNKGIPASLIFSMAILAGITVANIYYNQPLLELIRADLRCTEVESNLVSVITQVGYAFGLCMVVPMGDLYSRRRIISVCMLSSAVLAVIIALSSSIYMVWAASFFLGICSVVPQLFMPMTAQYSKPADKSKNMGYVLSGLLIGILAARVVSGIVGDWLGWRAMFFIVAIVMLPCWIWALSIMPETLRNFHGTYQALMRSLVDIVRTHPLIRLYSIRGGFAFGSMLAVWSCMAFHLSEAPFYAGSDAVGMLGLCGIVGALTASGVGKWVPRLGIRRISFVGAIIQIVGWVVAAVFGYTYPGLIATVILVDIGLQCQQISNQSGCMQDAPHASSRANTIFMTTYFVGGSLGTFLAGLGWQLVGWQGVCAVGIALAVVSLLISLIVRRGE